MQTTGSEEDNPCADRWKNMINDMTSKMWGIFDKTGIFLALCRHGFVLVIADVIRSGELAKYPLAVVKELLDTFGMRLGAGYDVGCHFGTTVANSGLGEERGRRTTYVEGMGLEDLEGCERFFSRSNGLAKSCRYAIRFHRQQEITTYAKHFDSFETYANLSLNDTEDRGSTPDVDAAGGVDSVDRFHEWLAEEKTYLEGLKGAAKTNEETLEMEFVQKLVNLSASQYIFFGEISGGGSGGPTRERGDGTYTPGEKVEKDLERVEELEEILDIAERWTTESAKWEATVGEIKRRKYTIALDTLELLIVERIFELTKMNQSQTGLAGMLKGGESAIDRYNDAACALDPPMPRLTWEQVVEYAFLADFDILRDTQVEVQSKPWTRPAYRLAMDRYFKILRAREEIKRLNIEIRRVVTWIHDENRFLRNGEKSAGWRREVRDGKGEDSYMAVQ
ncbi:hypothetical protein K438DRAFT_2030893, partial [Mycena galopus ATCC 62051]